MGFGVLVEIGLKWMVNKCLVALELNKKVFGKNFGKWDQNWGFKVQEK